MVGLVGNDAAHANGPIQGAIEGNGQAHLTYSYDGNRTVYAADGTLYIRGDRLQGELAFLNPSGSRIGVGRFDAARAGSGKQIAAANEAAPAQQHNAEAPAGRIPDGTYECYSATTARFLLGGSAALVPGQWHGRIVIKGDTYTYGDSDGPGKYAMDPDGKLHWSGGAYTEGKTLGRYGVVNGTPTIAIGWPGVDVGNACTKR
ncbi:hypothetical protein ACRAWG_29350 [Methylobacterium sp. P31]